MDQSEQPSGVNWATALRKSDLGAEACCPHLHVEGPWISHLLPLVWFHEDKNFNWLQLQLLEQIFQPIIRNELLKKQEQGV